MEKYSKMKDALFWLVHFDETTPLSLTYLKALCLVKLSTVTEEAIEP